MEFLSRLVAALARVVPRKKELQSPKELERQVAVRPAELAKANDALRAEVEQRLRVEQTLREERERFRLILASIGDGVLATDARGRVNFLNGVGCSLTGWSAEEAQGKPVEEVFRVVQEGSRRLVESPAARALREGKTAALSNSTVLIARDGAERPIDNCGAPIRDAGGLAGAVLVFRDVGERRRAEAKQRQAAELLRGIADGTTDAVFVKDREGRYLLFNESAARFVGKPVADVLGRDDGELFDPEGARLVMARDRRVRETGRAETEEEVLTAAGVTRTFLSMRAPYRDARGKVVGTIGVSRDITDRKKAEIAVQQSEARYRFLFERNLAGVLLTRADGVILGANDAAARIFGIASRDELLRRRMPEFYFDPAERTALTEAAASDLSVTTREVRFRRADGQPVWVLANVGVLENGQDGRVYQTTLFDVTDHKRTEAERVAVLGRLRMQIDRMPLAYVMFDADMRIADWNPAAERIFGFSAEEALGRGADLIVPPEVLAGEVGERLRRLQAGDMTAHGLNMNRTKDGRAINCEWFNTPLMDEAGRFTGLLSLAQDVTARIAAEEAVRLRDRAIRAVTQGIVITDPSQPDNPVIYASPGFERLTGYAAEETVGRNCRFLQGPQTDPAVVTQLREAVDQGRACSVEMLNYRKDGSPFWNALSISPVHDGGSRPTHFVGVLTDVTEKRRLEEQFRQAQKMEAVGQLAGGVAHDFNNVLQVITGYGELLLASRTLDEPARDMVSQMLEAGNWAAGLTRQLLSFSRRQVLAPRVLDLNTVVADLEKMLRRVIGEDVELTTIPRPGLGRVKADPGQIEQVVLNLAVNARDAMPRGGKLTIETRNVELNEEYIRLRVEARTGPHVLLAVSDTGSGMTPEVQARIFEPFFTTKEKGKGTGLGLSTVFGIVKQAGGHVAVHSELGVGTSFKVYLPQVEEEVAPAESPLDSRSDFRGTETVLLVEDEEAVRTFTRIVLRGLGYNLLEAADGAEALAVAGRHEGPIHLLLSDVVMPAMGGRQLAERLLAAHPELKILFQSGYTDDAVVRHGVLHEKVHFLQKPYSPAALAFKVREVLDSTA